MLQRAALALVGLALVLVGGCGAKKDDEAPGACLVGDQAYLRALERAPAPVKLGGAAPPSDCLVPEQVAGQLANVGQTMIVAATKLNGEARGDPAGPAAVQLGYLLGAVSKGADAIHTDLVRRLNSAARFNGSGGTMP